MSTQMTIKHHLTEPILMAYSAGTLPEAFSLVVATHLSMCEECRARAASYDAVGGAMLDGATLDMDEGALEATLALLEAPVERPIKADVPADAVFPGPLRDYVGGDLDAVQWKAVGGGVRQAILPTSKDASVRLLHIPAGMAVPDHGHRGTELTLVLQGAFRDEEDRFGPGDVEVANEDLTHTPVAEEGMDCICLAATDAPLRFSGLIPRLAQPFLRI
ncbi:Transcriptional regulator [Candidatus Rhodobacter oscarellae]|uniref:Transcriptional regulator n=2 Tax=Candidatus Rhodobacter oscarellae TaxID=1675527 RepID=A0A0J9EC43_9RHOB|nr:Transcriptional regulator [Candidatus Rhodobacter lobularis]